jgi:hypothetical protein
MAMTVAYPDEQHTGGPLIELLYVDDCPNHQLFLPHLRRLLDAVGIDSEVQLIEVSDDAAARRLRFLGSPTLRINGEDVDPTARHRQDYALQCRLYPGQAGTVGLPPDNWITDALAHQSRFPR